ncbi:hypothetical protein [uncultured Methanobrevibacter sp.]|uniref:hypothetical protein n=1 Tax=uncultured Methanobrevibacter sp. TaxID=253161 RepID=UPI0025D30DF5|nr:hypothetical protein [uncultured Methanobrevibacter sp.]
MKKIFFLSILLIMLTIGAACATDNTTSNELKADNIDVPIAQTIEDNNSLNTNNIQEEPTQITENTPSGEKLNASYMIYVDGEYLRGSRFEGEFNIEMYDREFLNGQLEVYIDDNLKFKTNPAIDYGSDTYSWESADYKNSYCLWNIYFLDELELEYGLHKAEFKYSGDSLFNDFDEIRYFNYTYMRFYVPEDENEYESTCRICVESYDATGNLKILLDNKTIHDEKFTGYEYIDLENLTYGNHAYDIYYTGKYNFESIHKHGTFNRTYSLYAYLSDDEGKLPIDENIINIELPEDAKSNITVIVNNKTYMTPTKNGKASVTITNFNIGQNYIYITYKDDKYYEKTIIKNITVIPALHFTYADSDKYQSDANVELIMSENAKGTLKVKVDEDYFTSDLSNGKASVPLNMVMNGTHDFEITYVGDYGEYFKNETYENISIINVTKKDWDMEFSFYLDTTLSEPYLYIIVTTPYEFGVTETYYIDGEKCAQYTHYDYAYYDWESREEAYKNLGDYYSKLANGTHTLTVRHSGNDDYIAKSKTVTFSKPFDGKIHSGANIALDDDMVRLELPEGESGILTVKINNTTKKVNIANKTSFSYPLNLKEGVWNINVTYQGKNISKTKVFKLDNLPYFDITCEEYFYKDTTKAAYIEYNEDSFLKHVNVLIDNKKYTGSLKYGKIDLSKLAAGKHSIRVDYKNSENKVLKSIKKTFTILSYSYPKIELKDTNSQELNSNLNSYPPTITLSDDTTLIMDINLNGNVKGTVTVYKTLVDFYGRYGDELDETIIGTYKSFSLSKGKAQISIPTKILNKTYSIKLAIKINGGNTIYKSFKTYWSPKVVHPTKMIYGDKKTLTIYTPGYDNKVIGMFGKFKPIYSKIINGTAKFSLSTLPVRNGVPVTFIYTQDEYDEDLGYYNSILDTYNLKLNIQDTASEKINMYYNDGTAYSLKVAKIYGKEVKKGQTVTFKIGKNKFKVKTDKNGVAKLKISDKVTPGKYTLIATYKNAKISKKLTVKQVLTVKSVKVKKSAKKLVLQATLKSKKVLKGKTLTFKFNEKTYKTKTNSKGIAKVTINKSVLSKLKVGKKITYQATYLKDTIKKTVKVLK